MIDFDVELTLNAANYNERGFSGYIAALEHMVTPELCARLLNDAPDAGYRSQMEYSTQDVRDEPLWRLGVIMFELLHGYSPWDSPDEDAPELFAATFLIDEEELAIMRAHRDDRRRRMINDPVQISETVPMTQDCVDVLRAMLANKVEDRPSIEELVAFPWFQGSYVDSGDDFIRPERADSDSD